jgi:hypothetical protein
MAVDERSRRVLYDSLETAMGTDAADILFEHLPPAGWGDVATTSDLTELEARVGERIEALRADFQALRADFQALRADFHQELQRALVSQTRIIVFSLVGALAAVAGLDVVGS